MTACAAVSRTFISNSVINYSQPRMMGIPIGDGHPCSIDPAQEKIYAQTVDLVKEESGNNNGGKFKAYETE